MRKQITLNDDLYLSYNPNPAKETALFDLILGFESEAETAICLDGSFYILNGDWLDEFENAYEEGGQQGLMSLFVQYYPNCASKYSERWGK